MPHKLPYRIAHFSSEDSVMHARDLLYQGPGIRGWGSARYSTFPQEIVFQLAERSHLTRLQLLAHQYLIPETIDIYIGDTPPGKSLNFYNAKFAHLGYVGLSDNEHTKFKARELKTINLDCTGTFLKLVLKKNHLNKLNMYNQVAIVALNILGNEVEDNNNSVSPDGEGGKVPSQRDSKGDTPLKQDLAFTMYVDSHVAEVITQMEIKREKAKKDKRQEYAKKLQATIDQLRIAGEKIGKFEIEKRQAIDNENFDRAKLKKKQIEEYREIIYQHYNVDELLEVKGRVLANDKGGPVKDLPTPPAPVRTPATPETSGHLSKESDLSTANTTSPSDVSGSTTPKPVNSHSSRSLPPPRKSNTPPYPPPSPPKSPSPPPIKTPSTPLPGLGSQKRPLTPSSVPKPRNQRIFVHSSSANPKASTPITTPQTGYTDYDERTLPALKHRSAKDTSDETSSLAGMRRTSLTEAEKKDAAIPLQIFNISLVEKFYSKNYAEKEKGLQLLQNEMSSYSYEDTGIRPDRYTKALVTLIRKALKDKVYSVSLKASQTLSEFLNVFINKHRVSKKEVGLTLEKILPDLITKTADNAQRIQNVAVSAILEMLSVSLERGVGGVGAELTRPLTQVIHPRSALCRANIVEAQLEKMQTSSLPKDKETGFTVKILVEFGFSALQHQNSDVRKCGERLLINLYHHYPVAVRRILPMEDEPARRNVLFRNLFEQLEELDRKRQNASRNKSAATTPQLQSSSQPHSHDLQQASSSHGMQPFNYTSTPGGSSTSSGFSTSSSTAGERHGSGVPTISITPDEAEARGRTLSRLNSSRQDLREEDEDELMSPGEIDEKTCIFCGQFDESFSGSGLDLHYWKVCPMLTRCTFCKQVIEIASLSDHLLEDCDSSKDFKRCERCTEAIPKFEIHRHVLAAKCHVAKPTPLANHCPLCHENIPPWDGGWRNHLMPGLNSCPANPRTKTKTQGARRLVYKSFDKDHHENGSMDVMKKHRERRGYDLHSERQSEYGAEGRRYPKGHSADSSTTSKKEIFPRKR